MSCKSLIQTVKKTRISLNAARRRLLAYAGILSLGAGAAAYLGYPLLSDRVRPSTVQTSSYTPPGNLPPDYEEFLRWLASVSKPYARQPLNIALQYEPTPLAIQAIDSQFFDASGINSQYNIKPYLFHLSDLNVMVSTQAPNYDVFDVDSQDVSAFKDHIISPTDLADKYPDLTYAKVTPDDFQRKAWSVLAEYPPASFRSSGSANDGILFVPFDMDIMIEYYRKDVFQSAGIVPPKSWDEYFEGVKAIDGNPLAQFGTVAQAGPYVSVVFEYLNHLASFGGSLWEYDGEQLTTGLESPEALAALENYVRVGPYSEPSSAYNTWDNVTNDLEHGYVGTALQFHSFSYFMNDPYRSTVIGKIGYAENPAGSAGSFSTFGGSGLGVSKYSKHPEVAWLWLQWATSPGAQEVMFLNPFHVLPSRSAVFDGTLVKEALAKDAFAASQVAKNVWDTDRVTTLISFPKWSRILDPLDFHLSKAFSGSETPTQALSAAQSQIASGGKLTF